MKNFRLTLFERTHSLANFDMPLIYLLIKKTDQRRNLLGGSNG